MWQELRPSPRCVSAQPLHGLIIIIAAACTAVLLLAGSNNAAASAADSSSTGTNTKTSDLACGACRVVTRALSAGMSSGSSQKKQRQKNVQTKKIADLLDSVCRRLPAHARMRHPEKSDRWGLVPLTRDDDKPVDLERVEADPGLANWLRMRCEELLDDREDDVAAMLMTATPAKLHQLEQSLCSQLASLCSQEQLELQFDAPIDPIVATGAKKLDLNFVKSGEL